METIKNDRKRKKRKVGNKARAIRIGKRVEKLQLTRRSRGSEKKRGEIRGNRKADGDQRAIQRAKYSIPVWRRTIPLNFHRIRAIGGIPFYPWKEGTYIGPCRINPRPGASPIRDKNKQRRRKKAIHASFLTSTLDLSLSLSLSVLAHPPFPIRSLSVTPAQPLVREVSAAARWPVACSFVRDLARFWFSEPLYTGRLFFLPLLSDTRETRNRIVPRCEIL